MKIQLLLGLAMALQTSPLDARNLVKRTFSDQTILGYLTERTCWWNEICKEEFQVLFRCKCPLWSYCRSPGRYYNAFCTMTGTGYIWTQPDRSWGYSRGPPGAPGPLDLTRHRALPTRKDPTTLVARMF